MTVVIDMRGKLEPIIIDQSLQETVSKFNMAARAGDSFILLEKPDGLSVGIYLPSVLSFEETDDASYPYLA